MSAQVITPDNHVQFIQTGKVEDFKPPEAAKVEQKPEVKAESGKEPAADTAKTAEAAKTTEQVRDEQGKFKKAGEPAAEVEAEDVELTEKVRKLIGKKHRQMMEAQEFATGEGRRALQAERRAAELEREIAALRNWKSDGPKAGEEGGSDPDEPKQADFKTAGDYLRAMTKYEVAKAANDARANAAQQRQQSEANSAVAAFVERQDAFRAANPDYDEIVGAANIEMPNDAMQYLIESEAGPALTLHLARNPDEITRLKKLSPTRRVAELGKLEAKLEPPKQADKAATLEAPQVSKAPAPIQALEGKTATVTKDPSQMNFQELREYRRQEAMKRASR